MKFMGAFNKMFIICKWCSKFKIYIDCHFIKRGICINALYYLER